MSLKQILIRVRSSFWYLPTVYSIIAFILAIISMVIDRFILLHDFTTMIPNVFLSDVNLAQTILSSLSTSLLTMTTITFSSILVVLTTYLSQFSPRTLQNFITDHHTQRVLGIFIGGFIYTIILLLLVRNNEDPSFYIVPTFAIIVSIICLGMFVFFIHHVTTWIKVSNLIFHITQKTIQSIHKQFVDEENYKEYPPWENWEFDEIQSLEPYLVYSKRSGYIEYIEFNKLMTHSTKDNLIIKIEQDLGKYVDEYTPLFSIWRLKDKKQAEIYLSYITISTDQEPFQDVHFGFQKLVEIALRAISPSINDPYTAINSINHLAKILSLLGKKHLATPFYYDQHRQLRVIYERPGFDDYLYECFYQIRHYAKEDISVMTAILKALTYIAQENSPFIKQAVWDFSYYIVEGLKETKWLSKDQAYLNNHLKDIAKACQKFNKSDELLLIEKR
ncbi:DUF2254 domain-containing protein [Metabacillus halosaccharovorans]|uniref:DUF2254 domain-containing protein n=1 Tax=Metabacillus halosaccharovorans TaxID=930124 RepID=UPI002040C8BF|nr:DUF2254 domain-containing protein [Metabacillus halosaccharovorans]MCM3441712.1 DUF2254 domain-containing protein [Metabacillus halosaccharovorans]